MTEKMSDKEYNKLMGEIRSLSARYTAMASPTEVHTNNGVYGFKVKCPYCKEIVEYENIWLPLSDGTRWLYNVPVICRRCYMKFKICSVTHRIYMNALRLKVVRELTAYYLVKKRESILKGG
jgi:hypothetical protein